MSTERADGYDPGQDPDADPEMMESGPRQQPDQTEGADDPSETGSQ